MCLSDIPYFLSYKASCTTPNIQESNQALIYHYPSYLSQVLLLASFPISLCTSAPFGLLSPLQVTLFVSDFYMYLCPYFLY